MKSVGQFLFVVCAAATSFIQSDSVPEAISYPVLVNQFGYQPEEKKIAFLNGRGAENFYLVNEQTREKVLKGKVKSVGVNDENTGDVLFAIDFTALEKKGRYRIALDDSTLTSLPFNVGADVYESAAIASLESFYFQRCGIEVGKETPWEHPPCHTREATFYDEPTKKKDVTGGWHDAGDYNKFVPTTAVSAAFLLYLYELQPKKFFDSQLRIPERQNGIPDILDEARWGLEWLLKMQEDDGGVAHKVSIRKWTAEHLPHEEEDVQYIFAVSSASTADFAAVTALGARLYGNYDKPFARTLLQASLKAWEFLEIHSSIVPPGGFKNPKGVEGGEYDDARDDDERLWASIELFRATGSEKYHDYALSHYKDVGGVNYAVGWKNVQNFAYYSYLDLPAGAQNFKMRSFIISTITTYCDDLLARIRKSGYRYVLLPEQQYWGSNSVAMGNAYDLIMAYEIIKNRAYVEGALDQLHYMLGRNTFGISFLTGVGVYAVRKPYHQFSMMLKKGMPVPGMLVAGCNSFSRLRGKRISQFAGKSYEDNEKNYFVNEPAINYTAPFCFVASYFSFTENYFQSRK